MGRKSKAKKVKKEAKKEVKKEAKKAVEKKKADLKSKKKKIDKSRVFGVGMAIIMAAILVTVGYLLFKRAFRPVPIAAYLPADNVIAYFEINSDLDHHQNVKTAKLLKNHEGLKIENILKHIGFGAEHEKLKPSLGRNAGIALVRGSGEGFYIYRFSEIIFKKPVLETLSGSVNSKNYLILDNYLFYSENENSITELKKINSDKNIQKLVNDSDYRKISDNLPIIKLGFIYMDFDNMDIDLFQEFKWLNAPGLNLGAFMTYKSLLNSEGFAVKALDDKFVIQSFLNLNTEYLEDQSYVSFESKYHADLASFLPADTVALFGGRNLEMQIKRFLQAVTGENLKAYRALEKILENSIQTWFGSEVSLYRDILPLFNSEFLIAVEELPQGYAYKLILDISDSPDAQKAVNKIALNFARINAAFEPQVVSYTLPDGTVSKEIVSTPEEIIQITSTYENYTTGEIYGKTRDWGIYYSAASGAIIISNKKEGLISTFDVLSGKREDLKSSAVFTEMIAPVLETSDEISWFNFEKLLPLIEKDFNIPEELKALSSLSSGKNYFADGITSINYLHIK